MDDIYAMTVWISIDRPIELLVLNGGFLQLQACGGISVAAVLRAAVDYSKTDVVDGPWLLV